MSQDNPAVLLNRVGRVFGKPPRQTVALEDVNLHVVPGEFLALIGPSGCGKSTLLRIIGDLLPATTGEVQVNGKTPHQARLDREYGIVFQTPVLFEWRTIKRNVELPLEVMGLDVARRSAQAQAMLERVELGEFGGHYPWQLSGGMQQRVAIARALAPRPSLLLMDEPFGALDELTRDRLNGELLALWHEMEMTILFVTHSIPEAVFCATRVAVMTARPGRIMRAIDIDLPQPRDEVTRESARYFELITEVREALRASGG